MHDNLKRFVCNSKITAAEIYINCCICNANQLHQIGVCSGTSMYRMGWVYTVQGFYMAVLMGLLQLIKAWIHSIISDYNLFFLQLGSVIEEKTSILFIGSGINCAAIHAFLAVAWLFSIFKDRMHISCAWIALLLTCGFCSSYSLSENVKIFLNYLNRPLQITAWTCWTGARSVDFMLSINNYDNSTNDNGHHQFAIHFITDTRDNLHIVDAENHQLFMVDVDCPLVDVFLNDSQNKMATHYTWLLFGSNGKMVDWTSFDYGNIFGQSFVLQIMEKVVEIFEPYRILPRSEIYAMYDESDTDAIVVKQIYRTAPLEDIIIENTGNIVDGAFIEEHMSHITSRRRQNLRGLALKASMVVTNNDTLNHLTDYK